MIRKANSGDCLNLAALSLQVWLHTYANEGIRDKISQYVLSTFTEYHFRQLLIKSNIEIWLYIKNDHLVGFIAIDLDATFKDSVNGFEIMTLYVSVHFQGQGIGRKLLQYVNAEHGSNYWLSTWVKNYKAISFYHDLGFEVIGELSFELEGELHSNPVLAYTES